MMTSGGARLADGADPNRPPQVGPFGGKRVLVTPELGDALSRLQNGESNLNLGGVPFQLAGLQQDMHNVLRDLQESPVGANANQLESMTIETGAMFVAFILESPDLPDSIYAKLSRLPLALLPSAMPLAQFFPST